MNKNAEDALLQYLFQATDKENKLYNLWVETLGEVESCNIRLH